MPNLVTLSATLSQQTSGKRKRRRSLRKPERAICPKNLSSLKREKGERIEKILPVICVMKQTRFFSLCSKTFLCCLCCCQSCCCHCCCCHCCCCHCCCCHYCCCCQCYCFRCCCCHCCCCCCCCCCIF